MKLSITDLEVLWSALHCKKRDLNEYGKKNIGKKPQLLYDYVIDLKERVDKEIGKRYGN